MRLAQFPIGVFGVAMSTAVLPSLSAHAARREYDKLKADFAFALRLLLFICLPAMAGLIALRVPIINILFERGRFDHAATLGTASALLFYSLGIWAYVGVRVVVATFYSMQNTRTPVTVAACALGANIVLSLALMGPMQHNGLALANALSSMINFSGAVLSAAPQAREHRGARHAHIGGALGPGLGHNGSCWHGP